MIEAEKGSVAFGLMQEIRKLEDRVKVLEELMKVVVDYSVQQAAPKDVKKPVAGKS